MTYKEAEQLIKDRYNDIMENTLSSNPPHIVKGCIIVPTSATQEQREMIADKLYGEYNDNKTSNKDLLLEMGFGFTDVNVYVLFLMKGFNTIMELNSYLESDLCKKAE